MKCASSCFCSIQTLAVLATALTSSNFHTEILCVNVITHTSSLHGENRYILCNILCHKTFSPHPLSLPQYIPSWGPTVGPHEGVYTGELEINHLVNTHGFGATSCMVYIMNMQQCWHKFRKASGWNAIESKIAPPDKIFEMWTFILSGAVSACCNWKFFFFFFFLPTTFASVFENFCTPYRSHAHYPICWGMRIW